MRHQTLIRSGRNAHFLFCTCSPCGDLPQYHNPQSLSSVSAGVHGPKNLILSVSTAQRVYKGAVQHDRGT
eukprot:3231892-Rhodomonas_salina.3